VLGVPQESAPLDMSYAVLRSVSPIHLEYLRNMGVGASMSISLLRDGELWGLIACHHYSPRYVPYDIRKASELLGHFMSLHFAKVEAAEDREERQRLADCRNQLLDNLKREEDLVQGLVSTRPHLLDFIEAGGAAVIVEDRIARLGQTPNEAEIREIAAWAESRGEDVVASDKLPAEMDSGMLASVSAGVLGIQFGQNRAHKIPGFVPKK
jgi:light-regulated signal transduction histidine kinase (bacteriophytochrome)